MLVLSRLIGQSFVLTHQPFGERLVVSVEGIVSPGKVRVGFSGPRSFLVDREEVDAEKRSRSGGPASPSQPLPRGETSAASLPPRRYERGPR